MLLSVPGNVFAQIILERVRHHLLVHQRPEQSGFPPKRSTIERILALRVLTECRREFWQGLLAAILSLPVCGEDVEVTERFTYLGSDIHISAGCEPEVNRRLGLAWGVIDSLDHGVWRCAGGRKSESSSPWCFQSCSTDVRL